MRNTTKFAFASLASLALVACGNDVDEADDASADLPVTETGEYDPSSRDYVLEGDAAERRAAFDDATFKTEYAGYRDEIIAERDTEESMAAENDAEKQSEDDVKSERPGAMPMPSRSPGNNMRDRSQMTWSYLDRNDDNQLSVAEYAIWAVPLDPTEPEPNDAQPPFVTAAEINNAADSFFYYDRDGDTFLSRQEFSNARLGRDFG